MVDMGAIAVYLITGSTSVVENCSVSSTGDTAGNTAWSLLLEKVDMEADNCNIMSYKRQTLGLSGKRQGHSMQREKRAKLWKNTA